MEFANRMHAERLLAQKLAEYANRFALVDSTCVCVMSPEPFDGVGRWYRHFPPTTDAEVCYLLKHFKRPTRKHAA